MRVDCQVLGGVIVMGFVFWGALWFWNPKPAKEPIAIHHEEKPAMPTK